MLDTLAELMKLPRSLGHPDRAESVIALADRLDAAGLDVQYQAFAAADPKTGERYALANIIGTFNPNAPRRFVIATHFDTRPWADEEADPAAHTVPVPGANDGTSGLVVALALAHGLPDVLFDDVGFSIVLFDGEELGRPGFGGYCAGSRYLAAVPTTPVREHLLGAKFGVVLDMVGDADLRILAEPNSAQYNPWLLDHIFATAEREGVDAFDATEQSPAILDDHTFLTEAGVPSVLLIDYTYPAWHTRRDTIEAVSERSLQAVYQVVLQSMASAFEESPPLQYFTEAR